MNNKKPNIIMKSRIFILLFLFALIFIYIIVNYYNIQVLKNDFYTQKALESQIREFEITANRGTIYDRNGEKLAYSVLRYRVYLDKTTFDKSNKDKLIKILSINPETFNEMYSSERRRISIRRHVSHKTIEKLKQESFQGIWYTDDPFRIYPYNSFASRTIGSIDIDQNGIFGIEYAFDKTLKGKDGKVMMKTDGAGRQLPYGEKKVIKPIQGSNVYLTIDEVIQHFTEKAIQKGLEKTEAKSVSAIVMDVKSGEILSMASTPEFDLNNPRVKPENISNETYNEMDSKQKVNLWNEFWKNPIISNTLEPGSTFKIITAAIGLETGVVRPQSEFDDHVGKGYIDVYGSRLKCWVYPQSHKKETLIQALENSCNPVFVKVIQRIGLDDFYKNLLTFGLNDKINIKLPGINQYKIPNKDNVGPVESATISYGHGIAVTPLKLLQVLSGVINNGKLVEPRILKKVVNESTSEVDKTESNVKRKIISKDTSHEMRLMLESVVLNGSGKHANIPGIRIGGKTGTAIKIVDGKYNDDKLRMSFFAFAPVEDPKISLLVIVDEPEKGDFSSTVAGPIAKDILESSLRYLGIKPDFKE